MFSRYDFLNGKELKKEVTKRVGTNSGLKPGLPLNRNQSGYKYRLFLIEDDLKKGRNPYWSDEEAEHRIPSVSKAD